MVWRAVRVSGFCFISTTVIIFVWTVMFTKKEQLIESKDFIRETLQANYTDLSTTCPQSFFKQPSIRYRQLQNLSIKRSVPFKVDPERKYTETVVIMTPISNAEKQLPGYFNNLCRLTYPHHLISIALIEDSSYDHSYDEALKSLEQLQKHFAKVSLFSLKENLPFQHKLGRHEMGWQLKRRSHLAISRNSLLSRGLGNETWVLWMDSDVQYIPFDLIEQVLAAEKDIVVPSCMFQSGKTVDIYDKNTWKDSEVARQFLKDKGNNFLMLEGYGPPMRSYLNKLKRKGNIIEIDGVGGCVLLIKADLHRKGLVFPPYIYKNHIETEGLAKMAQDMGLKIYGLPNLEVYHE